MRNKFFVSGWNKFVRSFLIGDATLTNSTPTVGAELAVPISPLTETLHDPQVQTLHPAKTTPLNSPMLTETTQSEAHAPPTPTDIATPVSSEASIDSSIATVSEPLPQQKPEPEPELLESTPLPAALPQAPSIPATAESVQVPVPQPKPVATLPTAPPNPAPLPRIQTGTWFAQAEAVVGLGHRNKNLPCQDAAHANAQTPSGRPMVVVADGAGSAVVSELGAQAVVAGMARLVDTLNKSLGLLLDAPHAPTDDAVREQTFTLVKHARGILIDVAAAHRRVVKDVRCTLVMAIMGTHSMLWLRVGDGALVIEERIASASDATVFTTQCRSLGNAGKGEFANETTFLDIAQPCDIQYGCIPVDYLSAVAAMSDGASEKLVSNDGSKVAGRFSNELFAQLAEDKLPRQRLTSMFYEDSFCKGTTGDDRSLAMLARDWKAVVIPVAATPNKEVSAPVFSVLEKTNPATAHSEKVLASNAPTVSHKKSKRR